MKRLLLAALLACPALAAAATSDFSRAAAGTTGSEFLLMDTSARGIAMGGAFTAASNDASSIYWNPAGLSQVPRFSATFMHSRYLADITYNAMAAAARVNDSSVVGGGVRYLDGGAIDRTDINGLTRGTFTPRSYVAELAWGQAIYDLSDAEMDVAVGAAVKAIRTDIGAVATGWGSDYGVQARFYSAAQTYDVGVAVQNLGMGTKFDKVRDSMPTRLRIGGGVRPVKPLLLTAEVLAPINNAPHGAAGAEWTLESERVAKIALRGGFNSLTAESLGFASGLSFGFGVGVSDLSFDYAFVPLGALGSQTHRLSVSFNLPAKVSRRYRER
ncbi:MAG: PorV/PorQ family protein [Elusimicrobiota bacterium]|nr:PorV/PorQ family protein [Elusimicrobiota bacterium]